jgi:hypothetical protein
MDKVVSIMPFLKSTRFWALVLIGLSIWFNQLGWIPAELQAFIYTVAGGHVGLRTIDRFSENINKKK